MYSCKIGTPFNYVEIVEQTNYIELSISELLPPDDLSNPQTNVATILLDKDTAYLVISSLTSILDCVHDKLKSYYDNVSVD